MRERRNVTVLGVTGSGKSTWIGALADGLSRGAMSRIAFDDDAWPDDTSSLDRVRSYIQLGEYPGHTSKEMHAVVELALRIERGVGTGEKVRLKMSDYDGELIEDLFRDRTRGWDDAWLRRARADSFLLFLRHDFAKKLRPLRRPRPAATKTVENQSSDPLVASSPESLRNSPIAERSLPEAPPAASNDPRYVPTALALVELLQWIRRERGLLPVELTPEDKPLRIGVVLTAWDTIAPEWKREAPEKYLATHFSIVRDFLASNFRDDEVRVFSLSATGGDLKDEGYRKRFIEADSPCSRVYWTDDTQGLVEDTDLAVPLCWAIYGDQGLID